MWKVFAVHQNQAGLQKLELILGDISSPNSAKYQNWLSFDEVTKLVINTVATESVLSWLKNSYTLDEDGQKVFAKVTWQSLRGEYIKATAPIAHWNKVLHTEFYEFSHQQKSSYGKVPMQSRCLLNDIGIIRVSFVRLQKEQFIALRITNCLLI